MGTPVPAPTTEASAPKPEAETPRIFKAEQLDQLLAPIALYPDPLLEADRRRLPSPASAVNSLASANISA